MNGQTLVVHLGWKMEEQHVVASRLKKGIYYEESESQEDNLYFKLKKYAYFPHNETVCQIVAKEVNNIGCVLLRSETDAQLISLQVEEQGVKSTKCDVFNSSLTTDVALSDTLPGVWALACANGEVFLENAQGENFLWHTSFQKKRVTPHMSFYHCDFGKHPLSLIVGNESTIWVCDTRIKAKTNICNELKKGSAVRTVLEVQEMRKYFSTFEEICSFTHIKRLPYMYVVTADSIYVMDERYCKMPVMIWKHMLMKRPSYTSIQKFGDMEFLMLANSHEKKVSVISNEWVTNNYNSWCRGVSLPKHFLIAEDTINFAHRQDLWFRHQVQDRLESSWVGVTSFVHPNDNSSMLFLSSYSNGDIFSQGFKVSQGHSEGSPQYIPVEDTQCGKEILSRWEEDTVKASMNKSLGDNVTYFDASSFYQRVLSKSISREIEEMFEGLPVPITDDPGGKGADTDCRSNRSKANAINKKDIWYVRELVLKFKNRKKNRKAGNTNKQNSSPKHWIDSLLDNYISDNYVSVQKDLAISGCSEDASDILGNYLPRKMTSFLKLENLKNCQDYLAPRILSVWKGGEAGSDSSSSGPCNSSSKPAFHYHTAPFDMTQLSSLPSKLQMEAHHDSMEVPDLNLEDLSQSSQVSQDMSKVSRGASQFSENNLSSERKSKTTNKKKTKKKRVDGF